MSIKKSLKDSLLLKDITSQLQKGKKVVTITFFIKSSNNKHVGKMQNHFMLPQ